MNSIPASQLVSVQPGVLGAGGSPLSLNAIFLTTDASIPVDTVQPFSTLEDVQDWFGATSIEAKLAAVYFAGFIGASLIPGTLYFAQYNTSAVGAYVRSGSLAGVTLAQLQALAGTLIVTIDGRVVTSPSVNLASATSRTNAAALLQAGLQTVGSIFSGTATQAGTTLTVSAVASGSLHVGDTVTGPNVGPATVVAILTGTGGVGTYTISTTETVGSPETVNSTSAATVTYDSQREGFVVHSPTTGATSTIGYASGTIATGVKLTSAAGAVLSQGAAIAVQAQFMSDITDVTQNWATFMTVFEPVLADKLLFAEWVTTTNERYTYIAWDTDVTALQADAAGTFGALTDGFDGVCPVWMAADASVPGDKAAFICGCAAALNFSQTNGRITFAYRGQAGLTPDVVNATLADNLKGNGYNFYGSYATANQTFQFLQPGQVSGDWNFLDEYINQIYLNSQLQLAYVTFLAAALSVPYNQQGYNQLRAVALDPVNEALNFGTIRAGVTLSAAQRVQVNTANGGLNVADVIQQQGWYLSVQDATPQVRAARGSPPMTFWYTSGQSIQQIDLTSLDIL